MLWREGRCPTSLSRIAQASIPGSRKLPRFSRAEDATVVQSRTRVAGPELPRGSQCSPLLYSSASACACEPPRGVVSLDRQTKHLGTVRRRSLVGHCRQLLRSVWGSGGVL